MEPTVLFAEAAKLGFVVLLLLFAVVYLARRDDSIQKTDRERTAHILAENRRDCMEREQDLSKRLRDVEDRQHGENAELMKSAHIALIHAGAALERNARAFEILMKKDSDFHALEKRSEHG